MKRLTLFLKDNYYFQGDRHSMSLNEGYLICSIMKRSINLYREFMIVELIFTGIPNIKYVFGYIDIII